MNFIDRFYNFLRVRRANPDESRFAHQAYRMVAGMAVNPETATQVATVWACMDTIAASLSSSNWNIYEGERDASNKIARPQDPLQYILNTRFNPEMTAQAGKRAVALGAASGMGYAEIERDMAGRIVALWPIAPSRVEPRRDIDTNELFFRVQNNGGRGSVDVAQEDLFIMRGPSFNGSVGDQIASRAIRTIATALAVDQYMESYFGNNATLGTTFIYKGGNMDDPNYQRAKKELKDKHQGPRHAHSVGLFTGEWEIKTFGPTMESTLIDRIKALTIEDIARWFHMPPHKIGHLAKATNNNIEHQGLEYSRDTLRPFVREAEQESDWKLLSARGPRRFVEIDVDWTEQGDYKSRLEAYAIARNMGVFSANDVLRKLGENTIGPDGDIRIVQGANVRLEDVGAAYDDTPGLPSDTAQAWLTSVYQRVQRRAKNNKDVEAVKAFARELIMEMGPHLGDRLLAAYEGVSNVIAGEDPANVARAALEKKP